MRANATSALPKEVVFNRSPNNNNNNSNRTTTDSTTTRLLHVTSPTHSPNTFKQPITTVTATTSIPPSEKVMSHTFHSTTTTTTNTITSSANSENQPPVIVLLGCSDSGKSTIFKSCRSMYGNVQFSNFHLSQENRVLIKKTLRYDIINHLKRALNFIHQQQEQQQQFTTSPEVVGTPEMETSHHNNNSSSNIISQSLPTIQSSSFLSLNTPTTLQQHLAQTSINHENDRLFINTNTTKNAKPSRHGRRLSDHLMEICEKKYSPNIVISNQTFDKPTESLPDSVEDDLIGGSGIMAAMRHGLLLSPNVKENHEMFESKNSLRRNSESLVTWMDAAMMSVMQTQPRKRSSTANLFFTEWSKTEEKIVNKINDISTKTMNERSWETDYEGGLKALKEDIKVLWKNQSLRTLFYNANDFGFSIHENIIYFLKNINRIFREDYKPTEDDYLKMRCVTTGITSVDIKINKSSVIKLYDTGGERCERRKWNTLLDINPNAIIYVISLSDFDMYSTDQKDKNKMQDTIDELKNLCQEMNMRGLSKADFLIVLNKSDVFKEKIEEKGKCISTLFPEFKTNQEMTISAFTALSSVNYTSSRNENNDDTKHYEKSLKFIGRLLHNIVKSALPSQKGIHLYETCALNKDDIKYIFEDGLEPLLRPATDVNRPSARNDNIRILVDEKRSINIGEFASNASLSKHAGNRGNTMPSKKPTKRRPFNSFLSMLKHLVPPPPPPPPFLNSVSEAYEVGPPKPYHKNISNPKLTPEEEEKVNSALQDDIVQGKGDDYSEKYSIKKQIGKGGQACTYIVAEKDAVSDKKFYVMKRIKMKTIQELNQNFNEIKSLYSLRHEYINSIYDFFVEQKESTIIADNIEGDEKQNQLSGKQEYVLCIILEFCKGGDMRMYLDRFKKKGITTYVSQTQIVKWLKKLTIALVFIHSKGYLHRDLKPENIFFNDLEREELRLGDFGLSCLVKSTKDASVGTINYMSPEQCKGEGYSASSDIWSLGAIILEILTQRTVNVREELEKDPHYVNNVCNELKDIYSEELLDFVCMTLQLDPQARPSTPEQLLALVENIE